MVSSVVESMSVLAENGFRLDLRLAWCQRLQFGVRATKSRNLKEELLSNTPTSVKQCWGHCPGFLARMRCQCP